MLKYAQFKCKHEALQFEIEPAKAITNSLQVIMKFTHI